jgi:hypothetical protein
MVVLAIALGILVVAGIVAASVGFIRALLRQPDPGDEF